MYTVNGAYATFDEALKGSLEAGKAADFAVLSHDYFSCSEDEIPEITSLLTAVDGRIVYRSSEI
jgi:predicted amidohydrolase YtcJ